MQYNDIIGYMFERLKFAIEIFRESRSKDYILSNVYELALGEKSASRDELIALAQRQVDTYPTDDRPQVNPPINLKSIAFTLRKAGAIRNFSRIVPIWADALVKESE